MDTNVCFYIKDNIDIDNWKVHYESVDITSLTIRIRLNNELIMIYIYNVYSRSSVSYSIIETLSIITTFYKSLVRSGEHILLKDFNLCHLY